MDNPKILCKDLLGSKYKNTDPFDDTDKMYFWRNVSHDGGMFLFLCFTKTDYK